MTAPLLTPAHRAAAARVFDSPSKRLTDLVRAAGLDPARDLRGKALRRVVLQPDEDLSGFDLSHADLSGAVLRRVDLRGVPLTGATLAGADLRGAHLPNSLTDAQRQSALTGRPPPALRQGPNRLWPRDLVAEINGILAGCEDDDDLFRAAREKLDDGAAPLAEHLFRAVHDWYLVTLPEDHAKTLVTRHELARAILDQGRAAEAEAALRALLPLTEKVQGVEHADTLITRHSLARAILDQGRAAEAEAAFRALLPLYEKVQGAEHAHTFITRRELALAMLEQGKVAEAATVLAPVPPDGGSPEPYHIALSRLTRAFLADLQADAPAAQEQIAAARAALEGLDPAHYAYKRLHRYETTRTPGGPGGTTLWMLDPQASPDAP